MTILQSDAKYRLFLGGVGSGKTAVGWMAAVHHAWSNPHSLGLIVATTFTALRDVIWREMDRWVPEGMIDDFNETKKEMTLINGSVILFRSADNPRNIERLRGTSLSWWWCDEITLMPKLVWDVLTGRLRQPDQPHRAWMTGTPKMNWVFNTFVDDTAFDYVVDRKPEDFCILKEIPTFSNVHLPADYLESLETVYSGQFYEQEVLGKFVSFEGLIYHPTAQNHITREKLRHIKFDMIQHGVDFGFQNPSAFLTVGILGKRKFVIDEYYARKMNEVDIVQVAQAKRDKHHGGFFHCDSAEPSTIDAMRKGDVLAVPAIKHVSDGIRHVQSQFDTGQLIICDDCVNLWNELKTYAWAEGSKEAPVDINNHACDALRYVMMGIKGKKKLQTSVGMR